MLRDSNQIAAKMSVVCVFLSFTDC